MNENSITPEEVIDYCIDNKVSIEEGMIAYIDKKLEAVEQGLASFKDEVTQTMDEVTSKVEAAEIKEVEDYLEFLNNNVQG